MTQLEKKQHHNVYLYLIIFVLVGLLAFVFNSYFTASRQLKEYKGFVKTVVETRHDTVVKWRDQLGLNHGTKTDTPKGDIYASGFTHSFVIDTLPKIVKNKEKQITDLTRVKAVLLGEIKARQIVIDSLTQLRTYQFSGKYLTASFKEKDTTLKYLYNADIVINRYWKRTWFLGKKNYYIDAFSTDPDMKINGLNRFTKSDLISNNRWAIGLQVGYYFIPKTAAFEPAIGLGVSYNLIRF